MIKYVKEVIFILGDDRRKLPWLLLLFLCSSVLDLISLALIGPYVNLVIDSSALENGWLYNFSKYLHLSGQPNYILVVLGLVLLGIFVLKAIGAIWINRVIIRFVSLQRAKLRANLMRVYQGMHYSEYLQRNSSEYVHSVQILARQYTDGVLQSLLRLIGEGLVVLVILVFLAWVNGAAMILFVALFAVTVILYDRLYRRHLARYGELANKHATTMVQAVHEGVEGMKEIRVLGKEDFFFQIVKEESARCSDAFMNSQFIATAPRYLLELVLVSFVVLLVIGMLVTGQDLVLLAPALAVFGVAALRLVPAANFLINGLNQLRFDRHATGLLYSDLYGTEFSDKASDHLGCDVNERFCDLVLNQVSFTYPSSNQRALKEITLSIKSGEAIGLIGASGSGKTTLVDLMLGLLEVQLGNVEFNGMPLREKLAEWRSNVAYLPQNIFLIDNTLRCNVALGVPEDEIDNNLLGEALHQAFLTDVVKELPQGIETLLGERGVRLSGGQRQRVALARAFYHGRNVLILDEATSALDNEIEREIVNEIRRLKGNKTMIVIAHRLSTVEHCDRIYRLDNGRLVEQGSYEEVVEGKISP